jgi:hypothetical protein
MKLHRSKPSSTQEGRRRIEAFGRGLERQAADFQAAAVAKEFRFGLRLADSATRETLARQTEALIAGAQAFLAMIRTISEER